MRKLALALALLLASVVPVAAHEHAPFAWWADANLVCDIWPKFQQMSAPIEVTGGDGVRWIWFQTAIGGCFYQGAFRFFTQTCNTIDGAREVYTFGPVELPREQWTTQERHGVHHLVTRRWPCEVTR